MASQAPPSDNPSSVPAEAPDADKAKASALNGAGGVSRPKPSPFSSGDVSGSGTPTGFQRHHVVNKQLDGVARTPGRQPSPQPTHLGIPGGTHRVLSEKGPGYVAAKFEGKTKQMEAGKSPRV